MISSQNIYIDPIKRRKERNARYMKKLLEKRWLEFDEEASESECNTISINTLKKETSQLIDTYLSWHRSKVHKHGCLLVEKVTREGFEKYLQDSQQF